MVYSHINIPIYTYINIFVLYSRKIGIFCPPPLFPHHTFLFYDQAPFPHAIEKKVTNYGIIGTNFFCTFGC